MGGGAAERKAGDGTPRNPDRNLHGARHGGARL